MASPTPPQSKFRTWPREHKISTIFGTAGVLATLGGAATAATIALTKDSGSPGITVGTNNGIIANGNVVGGVASGPPATGSPSATTTQVCPPSQTPSAVADQRVTLLIKIADDKSSCYSKALTLAQVPATLSMAIVYSNTGASVIEKPDAGVNLAPYMHLVPGTTKLVDSNTGVKGVVLTDHIDQGGVFIDALAPGASETVYFEVSISSADGLPCGQHQLSTTGVAGHDGSSGFDVATVDFNRNC